MEVPFADIKRQYKLLKVEMDKAISEVLEQTTFIGGSGNRFVTSFEEKFANYLGQENFVGCANGTDSIEILLKAAGIGYGDEVLVPAMSWISTSEAVSAIGAKPVFVDVLESSFTMDTDLIEEKITNKTKAIIPVHLYGCPTDMDAVMKIAEKYGLFVLEDCAQSHGAEYKNQMVGTIGHAASFSFYPGKNLGAYGDAGGMGSKDNKILEVARMIANHGQIKKHQHLMEGRNSRLDGIQAAVLGVKIEYLKSWNDKRRAIAAVYKDLLNETNFILPQAAENSKHVYHLYVIRTKKRDRLVEYLLTKNIQTAIHYPTPLPFLEPYINKYNYKFSDFPVAFKLKDEIVSIPMFPELSDEEIKYVADCLIAFDATGR